VAELAVAVMIIAIFALFFLLPHVRPRPAAPTPSSVRRVANQVKTIQIASTPGGTSSGTLSNGKSYTVVIPPQAGPELLSTLQKEACRFPLLRRGQLRHHAADQP